MVVFVVVGGGGGGNSYSNDRSNVDLGLSWCNWLCLGGPRNRKVPNSTSPRRFNK